MAYGRLGDGMTIEQARTEMTSITGHLATQFPDTNKGITAVVTPFAEQVIGSQIRVLFWSLMGAVAFVLLIACANVANLLLARAADRSREMAVRISIGATRWRLVRQLLVESVLLAFVSGVAGLGLAYAGIRWFDANLQDIGRPYWMVFTMDATVVGFFAAVCPDITGGQRPLVGFVAVGSRYFDAVGVRMLRGRALTATDGEPGREAMIINQRLADMHFRREDPIGKRIRLINDGNEVRDPRTYYEGARIARPRPYS